MTSPRRSLALGQRLAHAREARNWSQGDLAKAMKTGRAQVGHWETGIRQPGLDAVTKAALALGADLEWLITGRGQPEPTPRHHANLFRLCWDAVFEWLDGHPEGRATAKPCELVLDLYRKAAAAGLDRYPDDHPNLAVHIQTLAVFRVGIR